MDENKPVDFGNPVPNGGTVEKKGQVQYVTANSVSVEVTPEGLKISTFDIDEGELDSFTLKRAAEENGSSASSQKQDEQGSSSKAGTIFGILAGILALIGGGFLFASQTGVLPKEIKDLLPF